MAGKLVEVIRNGLTESIHFGSVAVVNREGQLIGYFGDPDQICYFRSSGKPLILLSHLRKKINERFGLTLQELAIMASSHSGGTKHVQTLMGIAEKLNVKESDITCGIREPYGLNEKFELYGTGQKPSQWHNNCSGKHLGNIAACKAMGWSIENYSDFNHPLQQDILETISEFCSCPKEKVHIGVDGCGVPVFGVPLKNMALAYARIFDTGFLNGKYKDEQKLLYDAVKMHPDMIAGDGRLDTELNRATSGEHFGKMGADGIFCVHIHSKGLGISVKVQDGGVRAVDPVVIETLKQLGTITDEVLEKLRKFHYPLVQTWGGKTVGFINPVFTLIKPELTVSGVPDNRVPGKVCPGTGFRFEEPIQ